MSGVWKYYPGLGWGWYPGYGAGGAWWSTGGWNYNVSPTYALRYSPPRRPRGGPVRPPEVSTFPVKAIYQPFPVLGVNRLRNFEHAAPLRPQGAPLTIAGREIQPLRPIAPRQRSDYSAFGGDSRHSQPVYPGTRTGQYSGFTAAPRNGMQSRPVFTAPANGYNGTVRMPSNTGTTMARPEASHYNYNAPRSISPSMPGRGPSAPSLRPSGGGGNSGGAPRSSGSSFGGGGGPARMGGGGGGGGAPHGSGGGSPHK